MNALIRITDTRTAVWVFLAALVFMYGLMPLAVNYLLFERDHMVELSLLTLVAAISLVVGYKLPLFDHRFRAKSRRVAINPRTFHLVVWMAFMLFLLVTFVTAPAIPIISAFQGATADELSQQRGFLKTLTGVDAALLYLSTLFVSALLPYSLVHLFANRSPARYALALLFFLFSISFLQKALFVNVVFPLIYLFARHAKANTRKLVWLVPACLAVLYLTTVLASGGSSEYGGSESGSSFFESTYIPANAVELLIWRSLAVPLFTAADTLLVFATQFNSHPLMGATSSLISAVFGLERVPMERLVFEHQWGWNDIANANAVFIADAYVNFGWAGVVLLSGFVGQSLRWFSKSRDEAFKSLWLIYCFALFSGALIGTLLSNGYILMFVYALFFKLRKKHPDERSAASTAQKHDVRHP